MPDAFRNKWKKRLWRVESLLVIEFFRTRMPIDVAEDMMKTINLDDSADDIIIGVLVAP